MSVIVQGGTIDSKKVKCVPPSTDGWSLEALARFVPPALVGKVLKRTGRGSQRQRRLPAPAGWGWNRRCVHRGPKRRASPPNTSNVPVSHYHCRQN